jgi:hypothetical protein
LPNIGKSRERFAWEDVDVMFTLSVFLSLEPFTVGVRHRHG